MVESCNRDPARARFHQVALQGATGTATSSRRVVRSPVVNVPRLRSTPVEDGPTKTAKTGRIRCWTGKAADFTAMDSLLDDTLAACVRDPGEQ